MPAAAGPLDSGRYRIGRLLGHGGLGEVYLAHDCTLDRDVAIKFLSPGKVPDDDVRRTLLREARAAAALDHPFICGIYEAAETGDGRAFIAMQYVEGPTLAALLQHGPLPIRDALTLCADVADALATAHRRGVVHRDLKPGNIMVTPAGHPKIVDFGIAKIAPLGDPDDASTATGSSAFPALAGTPGYMSPEQLQCRAVDGRSDLFALGLVLFECLTGRRAFHGATPVETAAETLHVYPPPPSTIRAGLTSAHDELCRRLLAKDPADRFQSADEVVGAIRVLLPDTSRTPSPAGVSTGRGGVVSRGMRPAVWVAAIAVVATIGLASWTWHRRGALPAVPEAADKWYRLGTDAIRQGGYHTARKRLERATQIFPRHALAYARLAEAAAELDDPAAAKDHLLQVNELVRNESRLPAVERLRLQAVRAHVLRDLDGAIGRYRELVVLDRSQAGALVDLGRAQEAAGRNSDARLSYEQAIARDPEYAPAYLRRGRLEALESRRKEALAAFAEAERLYNANSDVEGGTEVLLSRGKALDAWGDFKAARPDLERALLLAQSGDSVHQRVRAELALSSITAREGRYAESERLATAAVSAAEANDLDTIAADGLVDLAATLIFAANETGAEAHLERAGRLAQGRGARYTAARAKVQLAEVWRRTERQRQSLALLAEVLPFAKEHRYRRLELDALSIAARAHDNLGELEPTRRIASEVLAIAVDLKDETQEAIAASNLASVSTALGEYPAALRLRERADEIHRRQGNKASLPYGLTNRADLLIRLGRQQDAERLLAEVEAGIAARIDSYLTRERRVIFLRSLAAATALRCRDALVLLDQLERSGGTDPARVLGPGLRAYCAAHVGQPVPALTAPASAGDPVTQRERQYWLGAGALQRSDAKTAIAEVRRGLAMLGETPNDELRWRLAAVGALAARNLGDPAAAELRRTRDAAYQRLSGLYQGEFTTYVQRKDLADLKQKELRDGK